MDESRWPQKLREIIDELGSKTDGLIIEVKQVTAAGDHIGWLLTAKCPHCHTEMNFSVGGNPPLEPEQPAVIDEPIPEPAWYGALNHLPPGGTD